MTYTTMSYEDIKKELSNKDIQIEDIAKAKRVSNSHVANVARGAVQSFVIAEAICLALNKKRTEVFGNKYLTKPKRGPKDRTQRRNQIIEAIQAGQPVPDPSMNP
ncbi:MULTISPECIES: hypothetical protein [Pseudoalteromonas]|uniref:Uncharacterized protein n=1 Tax=Pseudoalteromonas luteoviolacea (strain 2ta16) TaxID=1353533 RepID=V4I479_PSEL2|nr:MULTISPECIES: hypothetical protein [Pseudoalteromonas]ESP95054.1 hypothetical protein PL2TA16_04610 [Pseudoalteromonas luteoviolacea 2ta16]KZN34165.1 hypothetical protein N483_25465 [Pseudoalteromonas luteoviolacea NCIMB 1944]MCG7549224.1 hypothetical protein [Pseudoalteromonas sp. Of7M-16]